MSGTLLSLHSPLRFFSSFVFVLFWKVNFLRLWGPYDLSRLSKSVLHLRSLHPYICKSKGVFQWFLNQLSLETVRKATGLYHGPLQKRLLWEMLFDNFRWGLPCQNEIFWTSQNNWFCGLPLVQISKVGTCVGHWGVSLKLHGVIYSGLAK